VALDFFVIGSLLLGKITHVWKLAIGFGVIDAVADHKTVGNGKAQIVDRHRSLPTGWLVQKGTETHAVRPFLAKMLQDPGAGRTRIDYVFDNQHILAGQWDRRAEM